MYKIAVFGTGSYYRSYKSMLGSNIITAIVDNSNDKIGTVVDGKLVQKPDDIDYKTVDYIVILVKNDGGIIKQLVRMGVDVDKIVRYCELDIINEEFASIHCKSGLIHQKTWLEERIDKKKICVVSHYFSRTGVPVVGMHTSMLLKKMGYYVLYVALGGGSLTEELEEKDIDYIDNLGCLFRVSRIKDFLREFDAFLFCTIAVHPIAAEIAELNKPVLWWINESYDEAYIDYKPFVRDNVSFYGDGNIIINDFKSRFPGSHIEMLYYYLPDRSNPNIIDKNKGIKARLFFIIVGTISKRKAQDVLLSSIMLLPDNIINELEFLFVGEELDLSIDWEKIEKEKPNIKRISEISQNELEKLFTKADMLICPSREDSGPVVVTQAFMNEVPCIVSSEVGQSEFMSNNYGGYVFESENINDLATKLINAYNERNTLKEKGKQARKIYEKYFSEDAHAAVLDEWISKSI